VRGRKKLGENEEKRGGELGKVRKAEEEEEEE